MKTLIRRGVFETNSSSAHSLSIAGPEKQFVMDVLYPNQNGVITLTGGEFGWEWFKHNDAETKANYAAVDFNGNETNTEMLIEVIKEQTGAETVILDIGENDYIDHDSVGLVPKNKEELRNFIFNKNSWLFGGNDNTRPDPTFYHVPEIRDGKVIVPVYKYELTIPGLNKSTKYLNNPTEDELTDGLDSILENWYMTEDGNFFEGEGIFWEISRSRDFFRKEYCVEQDYSKGYVILVKENSEYDVRRNLEENDEKYKKADWRTKSKILTKELLKLGFAKKVNFNLKEI